MFIRPSFIRHTVSEYCVLRVFSQKKELLNKKAAQIPADKLAPEINARIMKMLNGFARESSLEDVTASLVSFVCKRKCDICTNIA